MNQTAEFCSSFICKASCPVNWLETKYSGDSKNISLKLHTKTSRLSGVTTKLRGELDFGLRLNLQIGD